MSAFGLTKTVGIVGGLGPETTSKFYLKLIEKSRKHNKCYPHVIVDSVPLYFSMEHEMIVHGKHQEKMLPFLVESVKRLQNADFIAIPCNTAHIFIENLRKESEIPIISIVEEVIQKIKQKGFKKVGLLSTHLTVKSGIYRDKEIKFLPPSANEQRKTAEIIIKIIRGKITESDKNELRLISGNLRKRCDAILLACTDLQLVLEGDYLDSFGILAESVFKKLEVVQ